LSNYYIRDGASGANDGSDWTNAWEDMDDIVWGEGGVERGDTIYIADGTYLGDTFNLAESSSTYVYVKKAISTDHGTDTGWSSGYGDGQATFTGQFYFTTGYWYIDGQEGSGRSGHGFKIYISSGSTVRCVLVNDSSYVEFYHTEIEGPGEDNSDSDDDLVYIYYDADYFKLSYCWIHDTNRTCFFSIYPHHTTIEYCVLEKRHTDSETHGSLISINSSGADAGTIIRYSEFTKNYGTGMIVIKDATQNGFEIYGNIFYEEPGTSRYLVSNGIICDTGGDTTTDVKVYNNTFVNVQDLTGNALVTYWDFDSATNEFYNNICYNQDNAYNTTHDYNLWNDSDLASGETNGQYWSGGTSLFTDYANDDYTLTQATDAGDDTIGDAYNTDVNGNTRGADGTWDRGAYEYVNSGTMRLIAIMV